MTLYHGMWREVWILTLGPIDKLVFTLNIHQWIHVWQKTAKLLGITAQFTEKIRRKVKLWQSKLESVIVTYETVRETT